MVINTGYIYNCFLYRVDFKSTLVLYLGRKTSKYIAPILTVNKFLLS